MDGKTILKKLIQQYFIIVTIIVGGTSLYCKIILPDRSFDGNGLANMLLQALLLDLPLLVFYSRKELTKKQWRIRGILRFCLQGALVVFTDVCVMGMKLENALQVFLLLLSYAAAFAVAYLCCYFLDMKTASDLNAKIRERREKGECD